MNIIQVIATQRQMLLDGIDANEGDINLRIFEDFYPDEAHFIYELLQNAEDAEATEVFFELSSGLCAFEHNGTRHFDERDIRGITGIFNSSKKGNQDKIGKFGVGFKSVFVYTDSPVIYSKNYSFKILKLVLPEEIDARPELGLKTRFEIPFNNSKKKPEEAFNEIKSGLEQLSETSLLFLNSLRSISWKIGPIVGAVLREEHSSAHVEILKQIDGSDVSSSHWLRFSETVKDINSFSAPVDGVEKQKVSVAYELSSIVESKSFDKQTPISKQFKIVPAKKGKVAVFFPAEKETSGLRFHLHAPFVPELSRASVKESPENLPLFGQLAELTVQSLYSIKNLRMLSAEFLAVLPNNDDQLPKRYEVIREAVLIEMQNHALVPTYNDGFAPANNLLQARATLKSLLTKEDLAFLTGSDIELEWAIGATQRNSNQDRFLSSLDIENWAEDKLIEFFENRAREKEYDFDDNELDQEVMSWLRNKSVEWFQSLYAILYKYCEDSRGYGYYLKKVHFIKLSAGGFGMAAMTYFQTESTFGLETFDTVDENVLTAGTKKQQQLDAKKFLENLGVRVPNDTDEMKLLIRSRYGPEGEPPCDDVYRADLKRMIEFVEKNQFHNIVFKDAFIFKVDSPEYSWCTSSDVYIDEPFKATNLNILYKSSQAQENRRWPLDSWYLTCEIPLEKIVQFSKSVGCEINFEKVYEPAYCQQNPNWVYLRSVPGARAGNSRNRDFALSTEAKILLKLRTKESSLLIWKALCSSEVARQEIFNACYQRTEKGGAHSSPSQLALSLKELEWIPLNDGRFVKPSEASSSLLPNGFVFDIGFKWLQAIGFATEEKKRSTESIERAVRRAQLGFESDEQLKHGLEFAKLPESERQRILSEINSRKHVTIELPEKTLRNFELRHQRVSEQALSTPKKESVLLERSVQLGIVQAKSDAKLYLTDQYTNTHGQMICQVCKDELPFKLLNGAYYFEAVEVFSDSDKRFRETFLALCPNHSAAYQYAHSDKNLFMEKVLAASGSEVELVIGGNETSIYFTQVHLADIKACFEQDPD